MGQIANITSNREMKQTGNIKEFTNKVSADFFFLIENRSRRDICYYKLFSSDGLTI